MHYVGVDPGAIMTGIAVMDETEFVAWRETDDPVTAWEIIAFFAAKDPDLVVIVEPFVGTGRLNQRRIRTIEIVGYIYHRCREQDIRVTRQAQQVRLPCVSLVPAVIAGKDERAAAAHVLAYRERKGDVFYYEGVLILQRAHPGRSKAGSQVRPASRSQLRGKRDPRKQ